VSHKPGRRLPLLSTRPAVSPQPLRKLLPILLLGEQRHDGCEQFAYDCYPTASRLRFEVSNPGPSAPESSTLTTRLPSHPGMMSPCIVQSHSRRPPASNTPKYTLQLSCSLGDVFNQPFRSSTSSFLHTVTLPLSSWLSVRAPWHSSMPGSTLCMSVCPSLSLSLSLSVTVL